MSRLLGRLSRTWARLTKGSDLDDLPEFLEITGYVNADLIEWKELFKYGIRSLEDFKGLVENPDSGRIVMREMAGRQVPVIIVAKGPCRVAILPDGRIFGAWVEGAEQAAVERQELN